MSEGNKPLSALSLQSKPGNAEQLARQNREQHERIQTLQAQRDEALREAAEATQAYDELEAQHAALRASHTQLRGQATQLQDELAHHRRQLAAATHLFWEDRAQIAQLTASVRALQAELELLRVRVQDVAASPGALLVRRELQELAKAPTPTPGSKPQL